MQTLRIYPIGLALLAVLSWSATAHGEVYSFELNPPNTAINPATGDEIRIGGAGIFDTDLGAVKAHGSFTHFDAAGAVVARGTWKATSFNGFISFGGPSPGFQGGFLEMTVTLFPRGGTPVTDVPMTVLCHVGDVPEEFEDQEEGTTVGDFTHKTGGLTLLNLHKGR